LLGDNPGVRQKLFEVRDNAMLPITVPSDSLRAYPSAQTGKVVFDSNAGKAVLSVVVNVPVTPFAQGVFTGAVTPRQLAEKTRTAVKEAAKLIENGEVERWYKANGWTYPVSGPRASGVGAVQQLLEALGLVSAPRVELDTVAVFLSGQPGERVREELTVLTRERRAVIAHATCDQPWLRVGRTRFHGRSATIPLTVSVVPHEPGATLRCQVNVLANGNQRFAVPVTLAIGDEFEHPLLPEPASPPAILTDEFLCAYSPLPVFARRSKWWPPLVPAILLLAGLLMAAAHDLWNSEKPPTDEPAGTTSTTAQGQ
jgi:hypothetical protein